MSSAQKSIEDLEKLLKSLRESADNVTASRSASKTALESESIFDEYNVMDSPQKLPLPPPRKRTPSQPFLNKLPIEKNTANQTPPTAAPPAPPQHNLKIPIDLVFKMAPPPPPPIQSAEDEYARPSFSEPIAPPRTHHSTNQTSNQVFQNNALIRKTSEPRIANGHASVKEYQSSNSQREVPLPDKIPPRPAPNGENKQIISSPRKVVIGKQPELASKPVPLYLKPKSLSDDAVQVFHSVNVVPQPRTFGREHETMQKPKLQNDDFTDEPEEIDYGEEEATNYLAERQRRRIELRPLSQVITFKPAKVKDFQNLDALMEELDQAIKSSGDDIQEYSKVGKKAPTSKLVHTTTSAETVRIASSPKKKIVISRNKNETSPSKFTDSKEATSSPDDTTKPVKVPRKFISAARTNVKQSDSSDTTDEEEDEDEESDEEDEAALKRRLARRRLKEADVKKIKTRVYLHNPKLSDCKEYKTLDVTSLVDAGSLARQMCDLAFLRKSHAWTIFEVISDLYIERPIRDFERIVDVLQTWEQESTNMLMIKEYDFKDSLSIKNASEIYPRMCGMIYIEIKRGKWSKRFLELKGDALYHSKDTKGTDETLLCFVSKYDVYTLVKPRKKTPKEFCFALKSQELHSIFENDNDYVHYLSTDHVDKMRDWILAIRHARGRKLLEENPELMRNSIHQHPQSNERLPRARSFQGLTQFQESESNSTLTSPNNQYSGKPQRKYEQGKKEPQKLDLYKSVGASKKEPLINIIDKQQGTFVPETGIPINQSALSEGKAPLVPFSARELQKTPGVDLSKFAMKKKAAQKQEHKPCGKCDCPLFAPDRFREEYCVNCFHFH